MATLRNAHLFRQFLAVVAEGSITAAAEKLGTTQPALTKSLHKLEGTYAVPLFERLPRGVALTVYGKNLLPHAQRIVAECRLADLELQSFGQGENRHRTWWRLLQMRSEFDGRRRTEDGLRSSSVFGLPSFKRGSSM